MTMFTDGSKTADIAIRDWDGSQYSPEWQDDFFSIGNMEEDANGACIVDDVDYLIEQAHDMIDGAGDYFDPSPASVLFVDGSVEYAGTDAR